MSFAVIESRIRRARAGSALAAACVLALFLAGPVHLWAAGSQTRPQSRPAKAGEVVMRGAPLGVSPVVPIPKLLEDPDAHVGKKITIQGVAERVCTKKGCWMELSPEPGKPGLRVTFKDYGFFVPLDSKGMKVRAEGEIALRELSKEHADHLAAEGARIHRNADGTATEVGFVATGVVLQK